MQRVADKIPGYTYGDPGTATSVVTMQELELLKASVGFTDYHRTCLLLAGQVLADQTEAIVHHWRSQIIANIPNLSRHSRSSEDAALPDYSARSNLRFQQWILDTCFRPYDQDWLNYQQEIGLRHTSLKKNQVDGVRSTPYVPLRDIIAFIAVMNETMKPYLAAKGHSADAVDGMHRAWCKSLQLQVAIWSRIYADTNLAPNEW